MNPKKAKKIFEQYNRVANVVRCPYGRAIVRKQIDSYARAAVNLYGIISCDDFVDIFNQQNSDQTSKEEIYILLLPLILKTGWYGFYKEYLVHYYFFDDFEQADFLLEHQADKPRYIPEKNEFLKYTSEDYIDNDHSWNVLNFKCNVFGYSKDTLKGFEAARNYILYGKIKDLGSILGGHNLIFNDKEQVQEFIDLIVLAKNNTRIWENNGYTPSELHEIFNKRNKNIVNFPTLHRPKVGRNDLCPCGSGKKYKKCCAVFDDTKTAQLSSDECRVFYETWYGLMGFVNERKSIIKAKIKPEYPNAVSDMRIHKVREILWKNPELIDEYLSETELPQEKIDILKGWKTNHKKGMILFLEYQPEYAVAVAQNEQGAERLYGIKGISNSIASVLQQDLPLQVETVLLPFKGKIIYDSFLSSMPISFGQGAKAIFREMYNKAIQYGIITSLE